MRIAALYWRTTSVGGIHSILTYYKRAALRNGDTFDVLQSDIIRRVASKFDTPRTIRGGDSYITIDGEAPHHPSQIKNTLRWLEANYDAVFFSSLVPHPNDRYGYEPLFLPLFTDLKLPKVASVSDGYFSTYAEWGRLAIPHLRALFTACNAYAAPLRAEGFKVECSYEPFDPLDIAPVSKSKTPLTVWLSQWKMIKGINRVLPIIPDLPGKVELYNCGIQYYQLRTSPEWKAAVGIDHFGGFNGNGKAEYFGYVSLEESMRALQHAWYTINLQGITAKPPKRTLLGAGTSAAKSVYAQGSYNNTEREAMFYGTLPILHNQVRLAGIPEDYFVGVNSADEIPKLLKSKEIQKRALDPERMRNTREWVMKTHGADRIYKQLRGFLT